MLSIRNKNHFYLILVYVIGILHGIRNLLRKNITLQFLFILIFRNKLVMD